MTDKPDAPGLGPATDISAVDLDVDADQDTPASQDPAEFTDDATLGGTHGESAGGAG